MIGAMNMGGEANLKVEDDLKASVLGLAEKGERAIQVLVDKEKESLKAGAMVPATSSHEDDFAAIAKILSEDTPCIVLIRLPAGDVPNEWGMLGWTPDGCPVKMRMLTASSRKTLKEAFPEHSFLEYTAQEKDEVSYTQFHESTRPITDTERKLAMSKEELDRSRVDEAQKLEQMAAPKMLAGMASLEIKVASSFEEAMLKAKDTDNIAVVAQFTGDEELSGEALENIENPTKLSNLLPKDEPRYILLRVGVTSGWLVLTWMPEDCPTKAKMKASTLKISVINAVKERLGDDVTVAQAEATSGEDFTEDASEMISKKAFKPAAPTPAAQETLASAPGSGGEPPPGAVAMPGMAGAVAMPGMGKPPPGAVAMPGMGGAPPPAATAAAAPAAAAKTAAEITEFFTLDQLKDRDFWTQKDVDPTNRELYLNDAEFVAIFPMGKEAFTKMPKWKRDNEKKKHGLF
jgi:hypothetical protein